MSRCNCEDAALMILVGALWLFGAAIVFGGIGGWVWNIVKLAAMNLDVVSGMMILRIVGIVIPPLGAVLGFC